MSLSDIFIARSVDATRRFKESEHVFRSVFERDRDRILYSKEFRRLNRKTQVFVSGFDDHVRNRLTHTIEVAQISQTMCNQLGFNEALTLAIAYGHDVGHTPFGHVGERILNYFMNGCGRYRDFDDVNEKFRGFKHNYQSIRVVTDLEKISNKFSGLNLTNYTLWGILNHTGLKPKECEYRISKENNKCHHFHNNEICIHANSDPSFSYYDRYLKNIDAPNSWTMEALIVRIADEIAQRHHDLEDGLFAKIINKEEIIEIIIDYFKDFLNEEERLKIADLKIERNLDVFIYSLSSFLINFLVNRLIEQSKKNLQEIITNYKLNNANDFNQVKPIVFTNGVFHIISYSPELSKKEEKLQSFLKNRILNSHIAQSMDGKSTYILRKLITAFLDNPQQLPDSTIYALYMRLLRPKEKSAILKLNSYEHTIGIFREKLKTDHFKTNSWKYRNILMRTITDFLAGMTDDFAIKQYDKLFGTSNVFNNK